MCPTFAEGLRRALRQDPDVILVGEMRDLETIETAITAAETGHLVFSTLHTTGAARTIDRIVDAFDAQRQQQIRVQLSMNLKAVISQLLLPRKDGTGRVAAFEVMINTSSIGALLRDNKSFRIHNEILTGAKYGMVALETSLVDLYQRGIITRDQVIGYAQDPEVARQLLGERHGASEVSISSSHLMNAKPVIDLLIDQGVIDQAQADDVSQEITTSGKDIIQTLVDFGIVTEEQPLPATSPSRSGRTFVDLTGFEPRRRRGAPGPGGPRPAAWGDPHLRQRRYDHRLPHRSAQSPGRRGPAIRAWQEHPGGRRAHPPGRGIDPEVLRHRRRQPQ